MPAGLTALQVVNRALAEIARGNPLGSGTVSSNFDGSANGIAAATLYNGAVQTLLSQQDFEFARRVNPLVLSGNNAPLGWTYEYIYPSDCMTLRQVAPQAFSVNDPQATRWDVGTAVVAAAQTTVIWTNALAAGAVYTTFSVTEADFDSIFTEQLVRYLGSMLAMPVAGRPDFAKFQLETAGRLGAANKDRDS